MKKENLKFQRELKKLTQTELARQLGISSQRYGGYETGKREPDNDMLKQIADFFDVSLDYLLGATDDPTPPNKKPLTNLQAAIKLQEELFNIDINIEEAKELEIILKFIDANKEMLKELMKNTKE